MPKQTLSPVARQVEALLDSRFENNNLLGFLRQESLSKVESTGSVSSNYDLFAVRRNDQFGNEIFGPTPLHVGTYSEEALYGASGSPVMRFRSTIQALKVRADRTGSLNPEEVEYCHQAALLWAEIGRMKEFIGTSNVISEIVAELRTARFQFLGKDTPITAIRAIVSALQLILESKRLDVPLVDRVVEALEQGGIDSMAQDSLRDSYG